MSFSLYQEFYKLSHKKIPWIMPLLLLVLMVFMGLVYPSQYGNLMVMTSYNTSDWILIILVITSSTLFSMEFQNNTILTLVYKAPNKLYVYLSKLIVMFAYNVILHVLSMIFTALLILTPINKPVSWMATYQYHQPLVVNMFATTGVDLITSLLIISLIFFMSCLINSNSLVITLNIAIIFMGSYASSDLLNNSSKLASLVKWNPLNMINLTTQYYSYAVTRGFTMLSNLQLLIGAAGYSLFFLVVGYLIFRKKRF
ncbi:ABC transporter permease [Lentilactobacillus diolivorans]|uniref:ABC superfamily ATP binding cassette transporter, membrane protein n=1 Tax=Lentilactobacillus diolivorans DSM 14421 TaxID=1423739 RepID=A0A0R1SAE5_9LACO|nr:ABC transporter permease [Lentilactobacillus diolivorans]KRL66550.1 ABC superfamily ATP binding cassette transporter, membrane protein [Lentilactobacillus diolivorans DSM 14421]